MRIASKKNQGEDAAYLRKTLEEMGFCNLLFVAEYTTGVKWSGSLPARAAVCYPKDLGDFAKEPGTPKLSAEEVDQLAELLMPATRISMQDREALFQMREDQRQVRQRDEAHYFIKAELTCRLYRFDAQGISRLDFDGFWEAPMETGVSDLGEWVTRLPGCQADGYSDYTSFTQALAVYDRISQYISSHELSLYEYAHLNQVLRDAFPGKNDIFY